MSPPESRSPDAVASGGLVLAVFAGAFCALHLAPAGSAVAPWWPASGLAIALVCLSPWRRWSVLAPACGVAVTLAALADGLPAGPSATLGLANAAGALIAALVMTSGTKLEVRLSRPEDVARLVVAVLASGLVEAALMAMAVHSVTGAELGATAVDVFAFHAASVLVILPVALVRHAGPWAGQPAELVVQLGLLVTVTGIVFGPGDGSPLSFLPIPFLAWAALRFDRRIAAWEVAGFAVAVTVFSSLGDGPFSAASITADTGLVTQSYLICAALMSLPLAVAVQQRGTILEKVSTDEHLFRRNFTDSLVGMLFLSMDDGPDHSLRITDLNETAARILGGNLVQLEDRHITEVIRLGADFHEIVPLLLSGEVEGWQTEANLLGPRGGRVTLAISTLSDDRADAPDDAPVFSVQLLDVTTQHDARRQLEVAEQLTRTTLDTAACIIMVTDLEGTIVRVNTATTEITGHRAMDLVGRRVWDTPISPSAAADIEALLVWPNRSGVPVSRERDVECSDGTKLRVMWSINVVRDDHGDPAYAVMTGINVTAERTTSGLMNHLMQASFTTALVGIDTNGLITVFNSGAQHLLGYAPEEVVGRPFISLLKFQELMEKTGAARLDEAFDMLVDKIIEDGESRANDWTWISANGTERTVSMTLSIAEDAFASQSGLLCVGRDVTEQRESQETLIAALEKETTAVERLRALDEAKNDFVSTVSHELRTPITSIIGYTEMLTDGSFVEPLPDQLPMLETIARNGQRLIVMCNDLLLLSGMDSGQVTSNHESVDLTALLPIVEDSIKPLLLGRELRVAFEAPDSPLMVDGDRAQLERVLINLLSNAVKFTDNGGQIWVQAWADRGEASISVSDSGIGIPESEQTGLFQKFFRSSTAQKRAIQGTGLGLSIVSAIVTAHGGRIGVRSAHMQGTTFTISFPLISPARADAGPPVRGEIAAPVRVDEDPPVRGDGGRSIVDALKAG